MESEIRTKNGTENKIKAGDRCGTPVLQAENLHVSYMMKNRCVRAVRDWSVRVERGEFVGLAGKSGCGKTTAIRAVLGLLPPSASCCVSSLKLCGEDVTDYMNRGKTRGYFPKSLRSKLALIPQNPQIALDPSGTIRSQLAEVMRVSEGKADVRQEYFEHILADVGIRDPKRILGMYPFELSGGMCQRILIAEALIKCPDLIVADEPTSALDAMMREQMMELLMKTAEKNQSSLLIVSHDWDVLNKVCSRVYIMEHGMIKGEKKGEDIRAFADRCTESTAAGYDSAGEYTGKEEETVVMFDHVTKNFSCLSASFFKHRRKALEGVEDISFSIGRSESIGIVGESGSGKSTIGRLAAGLLKPDKGEVVYKGSLAGEGLKKRGRIQMIFQDTTGSLNPAMTIRKILTEALRCTPEFSKDRRKDAASEEKLIALLRETGLSGRELDKRPGELSGGERQRVCIAKALLADPVLLILDEPTASLDRDTAGKIVSLIETLRKKNGFSCLWVSHDLRLILSVCQKTGVIYRGHLVEFGYTKDVLENGRHSYTKKLCKGIRKDESI